MTRLIFSMLLTAVATGATAYAWIIPCNIPVFRYALERWSASQATINVLYQDELSTADRAFLQDLQSKGGVDQIKFTDVSAKKAGDANDSQPHRLPSDALALPHVMIQSNVAGRTVNHWSGSVAAARDSNVLNSPVRKELADRLIRGHSVVWLLVKSQDRKRTAEAREFLKRNFSKLEKKLQLPEGIGLPGSELHSEVPLLIKFSLLEIDPADEKEQLLVKMFQDMESDAVQNGEPLLVPVFGRGRALEVIPARDLTDRLLEDITLYLTAACSCQVKEQNPGIDLLMSVDWDKELFGEDGQRPPPPKKADRNRPPKLLTIPPGRNTDR